MDAERSRRALALLRKSAGASMLGDRAPSAGVPILTITISAAGEDEEPMPEEEPSDPVEDEDELV